jgi:hypothetical protein
MEAEREAWTWRRWQLVCVDQVADELIVDAIELSPDPMREPGNLVTFSLLPDEDAFEDLAALRPQLERLTICDDGVCDVFMPARGPIEHIALLQGSDLLMVVAPARPT